MILSHYDEVGNPVYIEKFELVDSNKEEFLQRAWKKLAAEDEQSNKENEVTLATNKFLQLIFNAHSELHWTLAVLDSIQSPGPVTSIPISTSAKSVKKIKTRPDISLILSRIHSEADRLETEVRKEHSFVMRNVLPLTLDGWRVSKRNNSWFADYGHSVLFQSLAPNSALESPLEITSKVQNADEFQKCLIIDGAPFKCIMDSRTEMSQYLTKKLWSVLSRDLFYRLQKESEESKSTLIRYNSAHDFEISTLLGGKSTHILYDDIRKYENINPSPMVKIILQWLLNREKLGNLIDLFM